MVDLPFSSLVLLVLRQSHHLMSYNPPGSGMEYLILISFFYYIAGYHPIYLKERDEKEQKVSPILKSVTSKPLFTKWNITKYLHHKVMSKFSALKFQYIHARRPGWQKVCFTTGLLCPTSSLENRVITKRDQTTSFVKLLSKSDWGSRHYHPRAVWKESLHNLASLIFNFLPFMCESCKPLMNEKSSSLTSQQSCNLVGY